jgi:hypothetical protein
MWTALLLALLSHAAARAPALAQLPESEASARMAAEATEFLDRLLGPGRAKVMVLLEGSRVQVQTQSEVATPMTKPKQVEGKPLPGWIASKAAENTVEYLQKDLEKSSRDESFKIKKMQVSVVLDSSLSDDQVKAVRSLLPDYLRMVPERGDDMSVLRASLLPPWRTAFLDAEGIRKGVAIAVAAILALLFCLTLFITGIGAMRTLAREIGAFRDARAEVPAGALPPGPQRAPLPGETIDLGGELPGLLDTGLPHGGEARALGRRFDFLSGKNPKDLVSILAKETPDDLAVLFAYLSDSNPESASRLFTLLPAPLQASLSQALVKLEMTDPEKLSEIESRLKNAVEFGVRGGDRLGRILSRLPGPERETVLGDLMTNEPKAAQNVESSIFSFEDLSGLKPEDLRRLIMAVTFQDWGLALRGAPADFSEKVLGELPPGARAMIEESLRNAHPREKVLDARSRILDKAFQLADKGQLSLGGKGASPELI